MSSRAVKHIRRGQQCNGTLISTHQSNPIETQLNYFYIHQYMHVIIVFSLIQVSNSQTFRQNEELTSNKNLKQVSYLPTKASLLQHPRSHQAACGQVYSQVICMLMHITTITMQCLFEYCSKLLDLSKWNRVLLKNLQFYGKWISQSHNSVNMGRAVRLEPGR